MTEAVIDIDVNDRVKSIRDKHSLKHQDISDITGYSTNTVKKWMVDKDVKHYTPAPIQALKLLQNWEAIENQKLIDNHGIVGSSLAEVWTSITNKGGVGKTTTAFNLALILANIRNKKVLAIDLDPQGHLTLSLIKSPHNMGLATKDILLGNYKEPFKYNENLDVVGTDKSLRGVLESIPPQDLLFRFQENLGRYRKTYDYIVCDGIPTDSPWFDAILAATTKIIMPVTADLYDSWGMQDVFDKVELLKMRKVTKELKVAAIIANIMTTPVSIFDTSIINSIKDNFPNEFCPTIISKSVKVKECKSPAISQSIVDYSPDSKVANQYLSVVDFIVNT